MHVTVATRLLSYCMGLLYLLGFYALALSFYGLTVIKFFSKIFGIQNTCSTFMSFILATFIVNSILNHV